MLRQKVYVDETKEHLPNLYYEEGIVLEESNHKSKIENISKIHIQPVTRGYQPGKHLLKENNIKGFFQTYSTPFQMDYFVDIDIICNDNQYEFESADLKHTLDFIEKMKNHYQIDDPMNLLEIHKQEDIFKYLEHHYKRLSKEYHLDNPRITRDEEMINLAKNAHH